MRLRTSPSGCRPKETTRWSTEPTIPSSAGRSAGGPIQGAPTPLGALAGQTRPVAGETQIRGGPLMELHAVMRTTFAARQFTDDPLSDAALFRILDAARFAPSGGNRQGWRVIVVREQATREALARLTAPAAKRYAAQQQAGESPWNTIVPTSVDAGAIERTPVPARLTEPFLRAPVVLVVCVDLKVVA